MSKEGSVKLVHQRRNEIMTDLLFYIVLRTFPIRQGITGLFFANQLLISIHLCGNKKLNPLYMKSIILFLSISSVCLVACNNNKPKSMTVTSKDGKSKVSIDVNSASAASDDMQKKMEELKKLTPLTTDQLKMLLPEELMGMKRSSFNANSMMGFASAEATYKNENDDKQISLNIFDCAGEAGAGIYSLNYWTKMSMQSESDNGYTKTVDFNGQKTVETYEKSNDQYELTYVASDRLLVNIKGEKTGLDAVKQATQGLNLKVN